MSWYPLLVLAPLVGVVSYMVSHVAWNWATAGRKLMAGFIFGLLVGWTVQLLLTVVALVCGAWGWADALALAALNQLTYLALADGHVHSVNILISSLRVRMLHELSCAPEGLTRDQILAHYNARAIVAARLERLTSAGYLEARDGRYYYRPTPIVILAWIYAVLKWILLGRPLPHSRPHIGREATKTQ